MKETIATVVIVLWLITTPIRLYFYLRLLKWLAPKLGEEVWWE